MLAKGRSFVMNSFRRYLTITLVASLIFSDAVAFWHLGSCHCSEAASEASVTTDESACAHGCSHGENPFAKRRQNLNQDKVELASAAAETSSCCSESNSPSDSSHDSENCSLCRWLFAARESIAVAQPPLPFECLSFTEPVSRDWAEPVRDRLAHDLSRRGPPATS